MTIALQTLTQAKKASHTAVFLKEGKIIFGADQELLSAEAQSAIEALKAKGKKGSKVYTVLGIKSSTSIVQIRQTPGLDTLDTLRLASCELGKELISQESFTASILCPELSSEEFAALIEGLSFAQYEFKGHKSSTKSHPAIKWGILVDAAQKKAFTAVLKSSLNIMSGVQITRDLINEPGGSLTPQIFQKKIESLFKADPCVKIKVRNKAQLEKEGFNGLITVGRGGPNPPVMVTLTYTPKKVAQSAKSVKLGLVGKGVTFDTGGISLKPPHPMWEMRMDMGGAGTVIGALKAISDLQIPVPVVAVVCLTENRPGANACLPGDIFTAKNGKTVMVENTDAEGRLILSDGLAEAGLNKATHIVDLATLTGAIIRAIGTSMTGLFSNNEELAERITRSGAKSGEKFWRLPLEEEYRSSLDDKVADIKNIGGDAGAITAGLFLQEFVPENTPWAHLDIAGTAFTTKSWKYHGWGATGWGVRSLVNLTEEFTNSKK